MYLSTKRHNFYQKCCPEKLKTAYQNSFVWNLKVYLLNWFEKCPYLEIECKIILHCYKKNWNDNTVFQLHLVLTLNHGCIYFQQSNHIFLKLKFYKFVHPLGKN